MTDLERANALYRQADAHRSREEWDEAARLYGEAAELYRKLGNEHNLANALHSQANAHAEIEEWDEAARLYGEAAELHRKLGNEHKLATALYWQANAHAEIEEWDEAARLYGEVAELHRKLGNEHNLANALHSQAVAHGRLEERDEAARRAAAKLHGRRGDLMRKADAAALKAAAKLHRELEKENERAKELYWHADEHRRLEDWDEAARLFGEAAELYRKLENEKALTNALDRQADTHRRLEENLHGELENEKERAKERLPLAASIRMLVESFDAPGRDILLNRIDLGRSGTTLEAIASSHSLSRERIRQLSIEVERRLTAHVASDAGASIREIAVAINDLCPLCCLASEVTGLLDAEGVRGREADLVITCSGSFERVDAFLIRGSFQKAISASIEALDSIPTVSAATLDEAHAALIAIGIRIPCDGLEGWLEKLQGRRRETVTDVEPLPDDYIAWNRALAAHFFNGDLADTPVYLDMEQETLQRVADEVGGVSGDPVAVLIEAVRSALHLEGRGNTFALLSAHLEAWDGSPRSDPPFIALLCVFSLAAEGMRSDTNFTGNNYYGRLTDLLRISDESKSRFKGHFKQSNRIFWEALNRWLMAAEGTRGLPTAQAFDRRVHVGLPISQALVREVDRRRLVELFLEYRLQPKQQVSREDMQRLLELWLPHSGASLELKRLWNSRDAKARIAEVAVIELEAWTGKRLEVTVASPQSGRLLLLASTRTMPRSRIDFGVAARGLGAASEDALLPASENGGDIALGGNEATLTAAPADSAGLSILSSSNGLSIPDLLVSHVRVRTPDGSRTLSRQPRKVTVLERDDENRRYVEVDRAELGRDVLLLVAASKAGEVMAALETAARPGWSRQDEGMLLGLPVDWVVFNSVQLIGSPGVANEDLAPLEPLLRTQIVLGGGLKLPGHGTWHCSQAPEIRVSSFDRNREYVVSLYPAATLGAPEQEGTVLGSGQQPILVELGNQHLGDGDYRVEVATRGQVVTSASFRIRSGSSPRDAEEPSAYHDLDAVPLAVLSASVGVPLDHVVIAGARSLNLTVTRGENGGECPPARLSLAATADLQDQRDNERDEEPIAATGRLGTGPSCQAETGAHHWILPDANAADMLRRRQYVDIRGECRHCGFEAVFPARDARPPGRRAGDAGGRPLREPVRAIRAERGADDEVLLDALTFARSGSWATFEKLAARKNDDPWWMLESARLLSALGHLDLQIDAETLRPVHWWVAPPTLVALKSGGYVLCGARSTTLLSALDEIVSRLGGKMHRSDQDEGPSQITVEGLDATRVLLAAEEVTAQHPLLELEVEEALPARLAAVLPPLSMLAPSLLPMENAIVGGAGIERFNFERANWENVEFPSRHGAYRLTGFPRRFFAKTAEITCAADNRLVKWIAASATGIELLAYEAEGETLIVPLGAQLPGLYERVTVLCSGLSPERRTDGTVAYHRVPAEIARALHALIKS